MKFTDKDHLWFVNQQGIWLSRDTAKTWEILDSNISCFSGFDFYDSLTAMVAYKHGTMAFTKDGCKTWEYVDNPYSFQTNDIEIVGQTMQGLLTIACGYEGTIVGYYYDEGRFDFVNNMVSYTTNPISDIEVFIKDKRPNIWWAGNGSTLVYRLSEYLISDVKNDFSSSPQIFSLAQNFPNPFNPTTVIQYSMAYESSVSITVYNTLGQIVKTFNEGAKTTGAYSINFNGEGLSSGVYLYSINAVSVDGKKNYQSVKKMILLK